MPVPPEGCRRPEPCRLKVCLMNLFLPVVVIHKEVMYWARRSLDLLLAVQ